MEQKEAFFRFITNHECNAKDFNSALEYFYQASLGEKEMFFQKQKKIFLASVEEMKKKRTNDFTQVKDVYQKFGMSNLYFEHIFHFFNNNSKEDELSLEFFISQDKIFNEAKNCLWDSRKLYKIAKKYHITLALLDDLLSGYAKEYYGIDKERFQDFKIYYRNFRKVLAMQKVSRFQRRQAYLYYQTYALPEEKEEFLYLVQNTIVKVTSIIDLKEATDAFLKENSLSDYDLYFYSTVQNLNAYFKEKLLARFQIYYDICVKYNFSTEVSKEATKYGITSKEFIELAMVYARDVLKIDGDLKKEQSIIYTKPIYKILDSIKDERDFNKIVEVLYQNHVSLQDVSIFCYCVNSSLAKEVQHDLERKLLTCLNIVHKKRIDEGHKKAKANQSIYDYARYYEYLNQDLNFIDFCNAKGINFKNFRYSYKHLKNQSLTQALEERIKRETSEDLKIKTYWCKELIQSIQNGITINGVHRKFNLFDYFYYYGEYQIHKYFLPDVPITHQERAVLNVFFAPLKKVNYINQDVIINTVYEFQCQEDDKGRLIKGTGRVLTKEELQTIVNLFNEKDIPFYDVLVSIAIRCFAHNSLVEEMTLQRK